MHKMGAGFKLRLMFFYCFPPPATTEIVRIDILVLLSKKYQFRVSARLGHSSVSFILFALLHFKLKIFKGPMLFLPWLPFK